MSVTAETPLRRFRVSHAVMDGTVFAARVEAALDEIDPALLVAAQPRDMMRPQFGAAAARAQTLVSLASSVLPPEVPPAVGLRGRARRFVQRLVRRLTHWLYEPRWAVQRELDIEVANFSSDVIGVLANMSSELQRLARDNEALRLELRVLHGQRRRPQQLGTEITDELADTRHP
jgi:hypothetical protein